MGVNIFYAIITVSMVVRFIVWGMPRPCGRGVDIGDFVVAALFLGSWATTRRDPAVTFGFAGSAVEPRLIITSVTLVAIIAASDYLIHQAIRVRHGQWMKKAGINPGGAYIAVSVMPFAPAALSGLAVTCTGTLLEELLFRGLLQSFAAKACGNLAAVAIQSTVFAAVHAIPMALARAPGIIVAYAFAMPCICGAVMGGLALAGRGLLYPWLVHWGLNYVALVVELVIDARGIDDKLELRKAADLP